MVVLLKNPFFFNIKEVLFLKSKLKGLLKGTGKIIVAVSLCLVLSPFNIQAYASETRSIGGIVIKNTDYTDAVLLNKYPSIFKLNETYVVEDKEGMSFPSQEIIYQALYTSLNKLENFGVNVEGLADLELYYEIVNIDVKDTRSHTFAFDKPATVYMYGEYDYQISDQTVYNTTVHEFGHYIQGKFVHDQAGKDKYSALRGIPSDWTSTSSTPWNQRPSEMFGEDFMQIIAGTNNRGALGPLTEEQKTAFIALIKDAINSNVPERVYQSEVHQLIVENKADLSIDELLYRNMQDTYLAKNAEPEDSLYWPVWYLGTKDQNFKSTVNSIDILNDLNSFNGLDLTRLDQISSQNMKDILAYMYYLVDLKVIHDKQQAWNNYLVQENKTGLSEVDQSVLLLNNRGIRTDFKALTSLVNRQQAAHWLCLNLELDTSTVTNNTFSDVPEDHPYAKEIQALRDIGFITGNSNNEFGWNKLLTREEMIAILNRAYHFRVTSASPFKDNSFISEDFRNDVNALYSQGIITGNEDGYLYPKEQVLFSEFLLMLKRSYLNSSLERDDALYRILDSYQNELDSTLVSEWTNQKLLEFIFKAQ
jgi:hypothetical protein